MAQRPSIGRGSVLYKFSKVAAVASPDSPTRAAIHALSQLVTGSPSATAVACEPAPEATASVLPSIAATSMPLIETESSTPALSETKAPGKTESAELERRQTKYYRGTAGSPVKLCANFIRITQLKGRPLYEYTVEMWPSVDQIK